MTLINITLVTALMLLMKLTVMTHLLSVLEFLRQI